MQVSDLSMTGGDLKFNPDGTEDQISMKFDE